MQCRCINNDKEVGQSAHDLIAALGAGPGRAAGKDSKLLSSVLEKKGHVLTHVPLWT